MGTGRVSGLAAALFLLAGCESLNRLATQTMGQQLTCEIGAIMAPQCDDAAMNPGANVRWIVTPRINGAVES